MLYDQFHKIAMRADWRQITGEYAALAIGAFVVAAVLMRRGMRIWARMQALESQLGQMQKQIDALLQVQTALIMRLNGKSQIDPRGTPVEMGDSEVIGPPMSPLTMPAQSGTPNQPAAQGVSREPV